VRSVGATSILTRRYLLACPFVYGVQYGVHRREQLSKERVSAAEEFELEWLLDGLDARVPQGRGVG
jgi:hypothetical protein